MAVSNNLVDGIISVFDALKQVFHLGAGDLTAGAVVRKGTGTQTGAVLYEEAVGVRNSSWITKILTAATANRLLTLPDADLNLNDVVALLNASTTKQVTAAQTDNTGVAANITGMSFPLAINKTYLIEGIFVLSATAVGNGFRLDFTGASGATESGFNFAGGGTTSDTNLAGNYSNANSPIANSPYAVRVTGYIKTGGTLGTDLQPRFWAEAAAQVLTLKFCRLTLTPVA